jgi:hypothetical protein
MQSARTELHDQFMLSIESRVKRFWDRVLSARLGIECVVNRCSRARDFELSACQVEKLERFRR